MNYEFWMMYAGPHSGPAAFPPCHRFGGPAKTFDEQRLGQGQRKYGLSCLRCGCSARLALQPCGFTRTAEKPQGRRAALRYKVFRVGHGLNLANGGWKGILAWTERIVKSEW